MGGSMSITGAVTELNKEIDRLTKIRDSLLQGVQTGNAVASAASVSTNTSVAAEKSVPAKTVAPAKKKRVVSAEARKKMSEASKARWAAARKGKGAKK
jgi:hypothetical protein